MNTPYEIRKARERRSPLCTREARTIQACERSWSSGRCDACGAEIDFDSDGCGHLVALDHGTHQAHRHWLGLVPEECGERPELRRLCVSAVVEIRY
jgi:hypothetical protein